MELKEMRDAFLKKKTLYENEKKRLNEAINKIEPIMSNISEDTVISLRNKGIDIDSLVNVDYERLKTDSQYFTAYKQNAIKVISDIKSNLEQML